MKIVRCDNHPDREAVITLVVKTLPVGSRPILFGFESATQRSLFDLCKECSDSINPIIEKENHA
jgi:hypothetical protein